MGHVRLYSTFPPTLLLLTFLYFLLILLHLRATVSFVVTSQLLYERVTWPNGVTSLLLISSLRALFRGRAIRSSDAYRLFPLRRGNTGRFANLICCLRGRCRTLTCFQFSVTERAKNNIRAGMKKCGKRNGNVTFVSERSVDRNYLTYYQNRRGALRFDMYPIFCLMKIDIVDRIFTRLPGGIDRE